MSFIVLSLHCVPRLHNCEIVSDDKQLLSATGNLSYVREKPSDSCKCASLTLNLSVEDKITVCKSFLFSIVSTIMYIYNKEQEKNS